tara:strand:+ start:604 stop:993 length:390 start_codon:yes stop_codon:yes gene_type:complete
MSLLDLTKLELEALGRDHYGVELDRRLTKKKLVEQLEELAAEEKARVAPILKAEAEAKAPVLTEVESATTDLNTLLYERTKPKSYVGKLFADANGEVLKFATAQAAKSSARRYDGKTIAEKDYFVVRKY